MLLNTGETLTSNVIFGGCTKRKATQRNYTNLSFKLELDVMVSLTLYISLFTVYKSKFCKYNTINRATKGSTYEKAITIHNTMIKHHTHNILPVHRTIHTCVKVI